MGFAELQGSVGHAEISALASNTGNTDDGIQQIRRRVALQGQHSIEGKLIVGQTVLAEVGVLDSRQANGGGHMGDKRIGLRALLLLQARPQILFRPLHRLIQ